MTNYYDLAYPFLRNNSSIDLINHSGLTKREYFAGLAMQGYSSFPMSPNDIQQLEDSLKMKFPAIIAELAVANADALIAELNKGEKE